MIGKPFTDESLCGCVAAMAVDDQDSFKSLLLYRVENVAQNRHVRFYSQRDRSRERSKVRRDTVRQHGKNRHAQGFRSFNGKSFR